MQDRLRLRRNPPNVAVPNGYEDIYADASGNLVKKSPDGTKEEVGGGVMLRTAAEGSPGIPSTLTVTGITPPGSPLNIPRGDDLNGFASWLQGGIPIYSVTNDGEGVWTVFYTNGSVTYTATKASAAASPVGLTGWTVTEGSGQPTITGSGITTAGSFIGQRARIGDSSPYTWEKWDGTAWVAD